MKLGYGLLVLSLLTSCARAEPVDLSSPETWLGPKEAVSGRTYTFKDYTHFYIRSDSGCLLAREYKIDGSLDEKTYNPAAKDIYALVDGSNSTGDEFPMSTLRQAIISNREYNGPESSTSRAKFNFYALKCLFERGRISEEIMKSIPLWAGNIQINIHRPQFQPPQDDRWFDGLEMKAFELRRSGRAYCGIRLGVAGTEIKKVRIDVLTSPREYPRYEDVEAIDCISRGTFAAFGYLGILRFEFDQLYKSEDLPRPGGPQYYYIGHLLLGFEKFLVDEGYAG